MKVLRLITLFACVLIISPTPALAYLGPGVGAGALAAVVGVVGAIFLALFAVLYYPIKRMLKKRKKVSANAQSDEPTGE